MVFPRSSWNTGLDRPDIGWIDLDNYRCCFQLAEFLINMKRSSFAVFILFQGTSRPIWNAIGVSCEGLRTHQVEIPPEWDIERQLVSAEAGRSRTSCDCWPPHPACPRRFSSPTSNWPRAESPNWRPTACEIPEDIIPCLVDDSPIFPLGSPHPVIYISQPTFDIGRQAANIPRRQAGRKITASRYPGIVHRPEDQETFTKHHKLRVHLWLSPNFPIISLN